MIYQKHLKRTAQRTILHEANVNEMYEVAAGGCATPNFYVHSRRGIMFIIFRKFHLMRRVWEPAHRWSRAQKKAVNNINQIYRRKIVRPTEKNGNVLILLDFERNKTGNRLRSCFSERFFHHMLSIRAPHEQKKSRFSFAQYKKLFPIFKFIVCFSLGADW